ncbi:MAG TPA: hypothetical protein VI216_01210 [Candidatus Acidoferrales bacterium]
MKHAAFLLGAILLFLTTSFAQDNSANSILFAPSEPGALGRGSSFIPRQRLLLASTATPAITEVPRLPSSLSNASPSEPPAQRPNVYSVFENYNWQLYGGYALFRFYAFPHRTETMNGVNIALTYYPTGNWFAADGDILGEFGSFLHHSSRFSSYMGGGRVRRRLGPRNVEIWAHGLAGFAKFLPQTALGGQTAFSYEVGGGVDLGIPRRRLAYRFQADMVGTRFFHTNQLSPKISIGVVYKF